MKPPTVAHSEDTGIVTVLSVGPRKEDHSELREILRDTACVDNNWKLKTSFNPRTALEQLRGGNIAIVICEDDLHPGAWKELLDSMAQLPAAPPLIVASRQADDRLWVEALNLGAYDVLAKPFDRKEVVRTLSMAWQSWKNRKHPRTMVAA